MIEQICAHLHNYFDRDRNGRLYGWQTDKFTISGGTMTLDFLQPGQYYHIEGSVFNDGVHQYPTLDMTDETFEGTIYAMHVPPQFLALANEIAQWQRDNGAAVASPYQSESFGGYSYTKASAGTRNGAVQNAGWETIFANRLDEYRKLYRR